MKKLLMLPIVLSSFSVNAAKLSDFEGEYSGKDGWIFKKDCTVTIKNLPKDHPMKRRISSRNDVYSISLTQERTNDHLSYYSWDASDEASNYFSERYESDDHIFDLAFNDTEMFFENGKLTRVISQHFGLIDSDIDCDSLKKIK